MGDIWSWISGNWIELSGALISLIYLYFSVKQIIWLWPFGLLSALFYIWIYYYSGFYADMSLQVYYVGISLYGWYKWSGGRKTTTGVKQLSISHIKKRNALILLAIFITLWFLIGQILIRFTDSEVPVMDALTTAGSIVATWMLARKILEHWLLWIVIDAISIGLYLYKELYATVILFIIYTLVAILGYFTWRKEMTDNS
jgi:nicotinamide mononucleotide transporter